MAKMRTSGPSSVRRMAWILLGVAILLAVGVAYIYIQGDVASYEPTGDVQLGMAAPDFSLESARDGATWSLADLKGQVVLLSFIHTQAEGGSVTADPSRAQVVFLRSMEAQYSSKGVVVLIVDATCVQTGEHPSSDDLVNFTYDWDLDDIPVLIDSRSSSTAAAYGVTRAPTTFLIDAEGIVAQRWDGFASAPQLAFALQDLVGPPEYAESYSPTATPRSDDTSASLDCDETPAQAKFAGLALARPLSEEIWVVDSGQTWSSSTPLPLTWVVLGGEGDMHLQVSAYDLGTGESTLLVDQDISPLPEDEAQGLLAGLDEAPPNVYLAYTAVAAGDSACMRIEAVVVRKGETTPLFSGEAYVKVE